MTRKSARMTVVVGNIRASGKPALTRAQATHDIRSALKQARDVHADVIHLTEMVATWRHIADEVDDDYGYPHEFNAGNETLIWRSGLKTGAKVRHLLTKGVPHVMMAGYAVALRTYPLGTRDFPVTFYGTHLAPGWSYRINSRDPRQRNDVRVRLAKAQIGKLRALVARKFATNVCAILTLDQNATKPVAFANHDQTLLAPVSGVMAAYVFTPPGWTAKVIRNGKISTRALFTDHPIIWAEVELTRTVVPR